MRRRGLALLPLGLPLLAIAEIAVFVAVVQALGAGWALLLLALVSLAGMVLLRREGVRGWRRFRAAADEGRPPGPQVSNSLVGLLGALLLALPGFVTGVAGLLLLLPPGRVLTRRGVERWTERRVDAAVAGDLFGPRHVKVRRGEPVVVVEPEPPVHSPPLGSIKPEPTAYTPPSTAIEGEIIEGEVLR